MTTSMCRLLRAALLGLSVHCASAWAAPTIIHVSESARAGDIVGIQGDGFGRAPQVWIKKVDGKETPLSPDRAIRLPLVNQSPNYVSALIPSDQGIGVFAVWIKSESTYSEPALINAARAWGANDLGGTRIDANRAFRLFGRNLYLGSGTPEVSFTEGETTLKATVSIDGSDSNVLRVTAPSRLVAGKSYTVQVSNGFGGRQATTALRYTLTGRSTGQDPFGLNVPWSSDFAKLSERVIDVKAHGAVGDGQTDDTVAVQAAIDAAHAGGGGIVYFPAGRYRIVYSSGPTQHSMLDLKSNVVLKGESRERSTIVLTGSTPNPKEYAFGIIGYRVHHSGLIDLGIENSRTGAPMTVAWRSSSSQLFMVNCKLMVAGGKGLVSQDGREIVIKGNIIDHKGSTAEDHPSEPVWMMGNSDVVFSNNTLSWFFKRIRTTRGQRLLIEGNHYTRVAIRNDTRLESGVIETTLTDSAVVIDNTITKGGDGPLIQNGDGETIMAQGSIAPNQDIGSVSSATSMSLTDTSKHWTYDYAKGDPGAAQQRYSVAIVHGPGMGQIRELSATRPNTPNTLNIEQPWQITPTAESRYAIVRCDACRHLVKHNRLSGNIQGIEYYEGSFWDITFADNELIDNGSIWVKSDYRPNVTPPSFHVTLDTQIIGNSVSNRTNPYTLPGSYSRVVLEALSIAKEGFPAFWGTNLLGVDIRDNRLSAPRPNQYTGADGEGYTIKVSGPHQQDDSVNVLGVIFQRNTAIDAESAFHLPTGAHSTAIWNTTLRGTRQLLSDLPAARNRAIRASTDTRTDQPPGNGN